MVILNTLLNLSEDVNGVVTLNPKSGETEAVTEPDLISVLMSASSVSALLGMLLNPRPLPLKKPLPLGITTFPLTKSEPVNVEPLSIDKTTKPKLGETDAVTEPLAILGASSERAENGISYNPLPLPVNIDADTDDWTSNPPLISVSPINVIYGS